MNADDAGQEGAGRDYWRARAEAAERERAEYERLLVDADDEALRHGSPWGLCDATTRDGERYPSAWADRLLKRARSRQVNARAAALSPTLEERDG